MKLPEKSYRVFWTKHRLTKPELEKLHKWKSEGGDKPDIKYRKTKHSETVEANSLTQASGRITDREYERSEVRDTFGFIARKFAEVYAVAEYREGESTARLDSFFTAEDRELIPKEGA